jgi:phage shock protein C
MSESLKLFRSRTDRVIAGVCGGLGKYFDVEPVVVRLIFLFLLFFSNGLGFFLYLALVLLIPKEPERPEASSQPEQESAGTPPVPVPGSVLKRKLAQHNIFAIVVIIIGFIFLLHQIFPQSWIKWQLFWPALLILFGVYMLLRNK